MVVVTIATLLLLEIALQTFFYIRNGYWLFGGHNSFSVKYVKPVGDRRQYSLKEGAVVDRDTINSEGFRGPAMNGHDHRPVICILGDSVPFGVGVAAARRFPLDCRKTSITTDTATSCSTPAFLHTIFVNRSIAGDLM